MNATLAQPAEWPALMQRLLDTHEHVERPPDLGRMLTRFELAGPGVALLRNGRTGAPGQVVNLSEQGLAVDAETALAPGERVVIALLGLQFAFRVVWSVERERGVFRAGLRVEVPES